MDTWREKKKKQTKRNLEVNGRERDEIVWLEEFKRSSKGGTEQSDLDDSV